MGPGSASALIGALSLEQAWHSSPGAGSLAHQKVKREPRAAARSPHLLGSGKSPGEDFAALHHITEQGKIRAKECHRDRRPGEEGCAPHTQHAGRCLSRTRGRWCAWNDLMVLGRAPSPGLGRGSGSGVCPLGTAKPCSTPCPGILIGRRGCSRLPLQVSKHPLTFSPPSPAAAAVPFQNTSSNLEFISPEQTPGTDPRAQAASSSSAPWGAPAQHPAALRPGVSARFGATLCQLAF